MGAFILLVGVVFVSLGITFFFVEDIPFLGDLSVMVDIVAALTVALLVLFIVLESHLLSEWNFANPLVLFTLNMAFLFVVRPLVIWHIPDLDLKAVYFDSAAEKTHYFIKAQIGIFLFTLLRGMLYFLIHSAFRSVMRKKKREAISYVVYSDNLFKKDYRKLTKITLILLTISVIGFLLITRGDLTAFLSQTKRNAYVQSHSGRIGLALLFFALPIPCIMFSGFFARLRFKMTIYHKVRSFFFASFLSLLALGLISLHRGRGAILQAILTVLFSYSVIKKPIKLVGIIKICLLTVTFLVINDLVETERFFEYQPSSISSFSTAAIERTVWISGSSFDNMVAVVCETPHNINHDYGYHFLGLLFEFLPVKERPIKGSEAFTPLFFPEVWAKGVGRAAPMHSEFYWSFSVFGLFILAFFCGFAFALLAYWKRYLRKTSATPLGLYSAILYSFYAVVFVLMPFSNATQFIPFLFLYTFILSPLLYLAFKIRSLERLSLY
jgi:oligosaccharide repeat unit polymerase